MDDIPVTKGYYRFTDIIFEWHLALPNPDDVGPLKALISHNALVHPDHPLRKPGVDGLELYLGTFLNGESRLLFSLDQIQYIQYWLHAMELTKEPIPIPGGDYLIQLNDLSTCSPAVYKDAAKLKKAVKTIDKQNKRLKGTGTMLQSRRSVFEKSRLYWSSKKGTWIAIDFEAWEYDHKVLTEFGYSLVRWEDGTEISETGHWIVKEHRQYTNGTYVKGARDFYRFGNSEDMLLKAMKLRIRDLLEDAQKRGPVYLVFHDASQDVKYLRDVIEVVDINPLLPEETPEEGTYIVDTTALFAALEGSEDNNTRGLEQMCRHLKIPVEYLHNAGNDAHYTMLAAKAMASGDPCDAQREQRWPSRSSATEPKVIFHPWEEDSDWSDTEGLFPMSDDVMPVGGPNFETEVDVEE